MSNIKDTKQLAAIDVNGLRKSFGDTTILNDVSFRVAKGTVFSLLGPNGAGKTTLINILSTLAQANSGEARVFGHEVSSEPAAVRRLISLTGQFAAVDEDLSGRDNLILIARLLGHSWAVARDRSDTLLEAFELSDTASKLAKTYSGGMRRRLDIAASMVSTPQLLFLDEPTTGLDPQSRMQVWGIVRSLVVQGVTVFLTTQYLEEADQLADRIAVIDHGKIIANDTPGNLKASVGVGAMHLHLLHPKDQKHAKQLLDSALKINTTISSTDPAHLTIRVNDITVVARTLTELSNAHIKVSRFSFGQPSLDEVFLTLTNRTREVEKTS